MFQDPQLHKLIRTALEQSFDLRIAATRVVQARQVVTIVRSNQFPTISGGVQVSGTVFTNLGVPFDAETSVRVLLPDNSVFFAPSNVSTSDVDGTYSIGPVPAGGVTFQLRPPDDSGFPLQRFPRQIDGPTVETENFTLATGYVLSGTIVRDDGTTPESDVTVEAFPRDGSPAPEDVRRSGPASTASPCSPAPTTLLMPGDSLRAAIDSRQTGGKLKYESLFDISREFDVSAEALVRHIGFEWHLTNEQTEQMLAAAESWRPFLEDRVDTPPPAFPERYRTLAIQALLRGEISVGRFTEYVGISRQKAMSYHQQETLNHEEIQVPPA